MTPAACRALEVAEAAARPLGVERLGACPLSALSRLLDCRGKRLLPPAGSVILLLLPYYAGDFPGRNIARYALADDYHHIAGEILQSVTAALKEAFPGEVFLPFVDSSPIPEVEAGALAGLGFAGRNGQLITPWYGSLTFLAEVVTSLELPQTGPMAGGGCGSCRRCLERCPTGALSAGGLEKSRCRSHITQRKGTLTPEEARQVRLGGLAWGCDICTDACPHNARPVPTTIPRLGRDLVPLLTPEALPELIRRKSYGWRGEQVLRRNLAILSGKDDKQTG